MEHKAGFVNIIGNPNVGKSTLMNSLIGEKLSIITAKAQTTRHRIMGILNKEDYQVVFSDTPGIVNPHYKLQNSMLNSVEEAIKDADMFLLVTEIGETLKSESILQHILESDVPVALILNKIDLVQQEEVEAKIAYWKEKAPKAEIIPVSALHNFNLEKVMQFILDHLPESPAYYSKEELTDRSMRFFVSEIIREKILLHYQKEIPYSVEVVIEAYKEEENLDHISALIYTERESQKAILIGHKGSALKQVGSEARKEIEAFTGKKIFLELHVKVLKNWRNDANMLKRLGYDNK
jgi:GTPase